MAKTTYIALLRGVNVGGHFVKMERLRDLFAELGLESVRTHIQSGNVFFATGTHDRPALALKIEKHLTAALGWEVPVFLRTIPEIEELLALEPFKEVEVTAATRLLVTFLSNPLPEGAEVKPAGTREAYQLVAATPGALFIVMHLVDGKPGNPSAAIERKYKIKTTTRFHGTLVKILAAAKGD